MFFRCGGRWKARAFRAGLFGLFLALLSFPGCRVYGCGLEITGAEENILFSLWRIGEEKEGSVHLEEPFRRYGADLRDGYFPEGIAALEACLKRDRVPGAAEKKADASGRTGFTDLPEGIYLLSGTAPAGGETKIEVQPGLFALGGSSPEDRTVRVKLSKERTRKPASSGRGGGRQGAGGQKGGKESMAVTVRKYWEDGNDSGRPGEITVDLLEDGNFLASAVLSEENGWSCRFSGLNPAAVYTAAEREVPAGYLVSLARQGEEIAIINRLEENPPLPAKLPQTGACAWPLLFAVPAGFFFLLEGEKKKRGLLMTIGILILSGCAFAAGENMKKEIFASGASAGLLEERDSGDLRKASGETGESRKEEIAGDAREGCPGKITVSPGRPEIWILEIPPLGLRLPVFPDWSYEKLRKAPCCWRGNARSRKKILCAHNYPGQFGRIGKLCPGDRLVLDTGEKSEYEVLSAELLGPEETGRLLEGEDWSLTLFTCTPGGAARIAVRLRECGNQEETEEAQI